MNSKERLQATLNHQTPDKLCVDFGATAITGMHISMVEKLREHYGLEPRLVKVADPFQMLGVIDPDLQDIMMVDVIEMRGKNCLFGYPFDEWKECKTQWGQTCLVPGKHPIGHYDDDGNTLMFPGGDTSVAPSAKMPKGGYFYDSITRQDPIDDDALNPEDNLEEFKHITEPELQFLEDSYKELMQRGKGIVASLGGTALGDVAFVPGMGLVHPKGIRDITEWYMSTIMRQDYLHAIFDKQTDIAIENLKKIYSRTGDGIDAICICGTDFGTQDSQFCSPEIFDSLYKPYYRKVNDWVHENTQWKTFKHSCGAIYPLIPNMIDAGFDCLNPVQISAKGMDPQRLKDEFGDKITFWGGGVDTQSTLMYGTPQEIKDQVRMLSEIFGANGGYVFNAVHNIQANVPLENVVALIDAVREIKQ